MLNEYSAIRSLRAQTETLIDNVDEWIARARAFDALANVQTSAPSPEDTPNLHHQLEALKYYRGFYSAEAASFTPDQHFTIAMREADWCLHLLDSIKALGASAATNKDSIHLPEKMA